MMKDQPCHKTRWGWGDSISRLGFQYNYLITKWTPHQRPPPLQTTSPSFLGWSFTSGSTVQGIINNKPNHLYYNTTVLALQKDWEIYITLCYKAESAPLKNFKKKSKRLLRLGPELINFGDWSQVLGMVKTSSRHGQNLIIKSCQMNYNSEQIKTTRSIRPESLASQTVILVFLYNRWPCLSSSSICCMSDNEPILKNKK